MFDIPETEMGEAMKLLLWREQVLRITVAPEEETSGRKSTRKHF